MLAPFRKWVNRVIRRLARKGGPPLLPAPVGPTGPAPGRGYTTYAYVPCGALPYCPPNQQYGSHGMVASGSQLAPSERHVVPGDGEDNVSSTMELGGGCRLEFRSWASASSNSSGIAVSGRVAIHLIDASGVSVPISETSSSSPFSASLPLVASTVELALRSAGVDVSPPNLELLEIAAVKAYRDSVAHTISAFASFFVDRVEYQQAADIWRLEQIRAIMSG